MNDPENDRLLNDIIKEDTFGSHNALAKSQALHAFQRRCRQKRTLPILAVCAITLLAYAYTSDTTRQSLITRNSSVPSPRSPIKIPNPPSPVESKSFLLTDEQLLAHFPPNACGLAIAGDKTILLFHDDQVRRRIFHDQN